MGGIKGLRINWSCNYCHKRKKKTPYYAKVNKYCNSKCQTLSKRGKLPEGLARFFHNNPEKWKEYGALANPKKISETLKRKGIRPPSRKGIRMSKEWKKRYSEMAKEKHFGSWMKGKKGSKYQKEVAKKTIVKVRQQLAEKGHLTSLEKIVDKYLHENKIKHEHEFNCNGKIIDFYLPNERLFLEADGDYWHRDKEKDKKRDEFIKFESSWGKIRHIHFSEKSLEDGSWIKKL